jgi:hypothetical protein
MDDSEVTTSPQMQLAWHDARGAADAPFYQSKMGSEIQLGGIVSRTALQACLTPASKGIR